MAEQIGSAAASEIASRAVSSVFDTFSKQSVVKEKLRRLEMLLIKIHSTVETYEKHSHRITNPWLLQWQQKLKEAATRGDELLRGFKQRAADAEAASGSGSQQQGSSSTSAALCFVGGMVGRIWTAAKTLFLSDEETQKLNSAVEELEELTADTREFVRLLKVEVLGPVQRRPKKRVRQDALELMDIVEPLVALELMDIVEPLELMDIAEPLVALKPERQLTRAVAAISAAVEAAGGRSLEGREWLAQWVAVLQDATQQGHAVLATLKAGEEMVDGDHREADELQRFVDDMELLADDLEDFNSLVLLCPSN